MLDKCIMHDCMWSAKNGMVLDQVDGNLCRSGGCVGNGFRAVLACDMAAGLPSEFNPEEMR